MVWNLQTLTNLPKPIQTLHSVHRSQKLSLVEDHYDILLRILIATLWI